MFGDVVCMNDIGSQHGGGTFTSSGQDGKAKAADQVIVTSAGTFECTTHGPQTIPAANYALQSKVNGNNIIVGTITFACGNTVTPTPRRVKAG